MAGIKVTGRVSEFGLEDTAWMAICLQDKHLRPTGGMIYEQSAKDYLEGLKRIDNNERTEGTTRHVPLRGQYNYRERLSLIRSGTIVYREYFGIPSGIKGHSMYPYYNPEKGGESGRKYKEDYRRPRVESEEPGIENNPRKALFAGYKCLSRH
ncbi:MAG: hypothetical protein F6J98_02430 [Moorea sp. SIO4G2]|nr:hypothetical protein [Moorena sp. SIO4G2]